MSEAIVGGQPRLLEPSLEHVRGIGTHHGRKSAIIDGPFGESKEAIGGYRFVLAQNLDEAAQIVKGDPCLDHGKLVEIRPLDSGAGTHGCWRNELATADNTSQ
jgi:hypothetical protein